MITYQWTHIERIISDNSAGDFNIYPCFAILPHFSDKLTFILWRHLVATFVAPSCLADKNRSKSEQNFLIKIVFNVRSPTELTVNFDKRLSADMSVMRYLQFNIYFSVIPKKLTFFWLTLRRPLRKKLRMRWFFDVSEVKESSFFKSDLTDPPSDFWCASFDNSRAAVKFLF